MSHAATVDQRARRLPILWLPLIFVGPLLRSVLFWIAERGGADPYALGRALGITDRSLWSVTVYAVCGGIVTLGFVYAVARRGCSWQALGWCAPDGAVAYLAALFGVGGVIMLWLPVAALATVTGLPMFWEERRTFVEPAAMLEFAVAAFVGAIVVPLVEEPLFRGYVLHALASRWGWQLGVLGQAALFGSYHVFVGPECSTRSSGRSSQGSSPGAGGVCGHASCSTRSTTCGPISRCRCSSAEHGRSDSNVERDAGSVSCRDSQYGVGRRSAVVAHCAPSVCVAASASEACPGSMLRRPRRCRSTDCRPWPSQAVGRDCRSCSRPGAGGKVARRSSPGYSEPCSCSAGNAASFPLRRAS